MKIVKVTIEDAEKLREIYAPYVEETAVTFEHEVPSVLEFEDRIKRISEKYPYIKAVDDSGEILGFAYASAFRPRKSYDHSVETTIYVKRDNRQKGVGKFLYSKLADILKEMGIKNLYACIAYTDKEDEHLNQASPIFHEKMGYKAVGRFSGCGYKFDTWYDMVWMEKIISTHEGLSNVKLGQWDL